MVKTVNAYQCTECGWSSPKWAGRCGECQQWGTVTDASVRGLGTNTPIRALKATAENIARRISEIDVRSAEHQSTGVEEFDRVLGGGLVAGAAILLSGEPGVGKSTLLLDIAAKYAAAGKKVLYITAEESTAQVRLRAKRTNSIHDDLYLAAETDLAATLGQVDAIKPDLLVVDSVQTISSSISDGLAGQPSQVREVASTLIRVAKERDLPLILVGHVTKDGSIAGPRLLEHIVDVVCHFEGDRQTALRFIRAVKNRYGPTDEVGCFDMTADGITEVPDPSALFRSSGPAVVSGTCVTITVEGKRAIPVEIQALVVPTKSPQPRRVVSGVDPSRVAMIIAVLERRAGIRNVSEHDIYVSTVGGVRLHEPGADLAIAIAIASAVHDTAIAFSTVAYGEISLSGDIRAVTASRQRSAEAARLGYSTMLNDNIGTIRNACRMALSETEIPATDRSLN